MLEYKVILINSKEGQETLKNLINLFGGATVTNAEGWWSTPQVALMKEEVLVVTLAGSPDQVMLAKFKDLIFDYKLRDNQLSVYVRWPSGIVEFL